MRHTTRIVSMGIAAVGLFVGDARQSWAEGAVHDHVVVQEDVVYGRVDGAGLLADIAYPVTDKMVPAIISVHGGRWRAGHKRDKSTIVVEQWANFGFFAATIDWLGVRPHRRVTKICSVPSAICTLTPRNTTSTQIVYS